MQSNQIPRNKPIHVWKLDFDKETKTIKCRGMGKKPSSTNGCGQMVYLHAEDKSGRESGKYLSTQWYRRQVPEHNTNRSGSKMNNR